MYENVTYEEILNRMLDRIPNSIDKREGSIIYAALAPAALELQNMYIELDVILNETFADTASMEYLTRRCAERGITPRPATNAVLRGVFNLADIPYGARFSLHELTYRVVEKIADGEFKLECETLGTEGNTKLGTLLPVEYIEGLESAELVELLIPGENEEDVEDLRERYFNSISAQAFGGNAADYQQKVNAIDGVGGAKVYPAWNGGGTVKIVIIDSDYQSPSAALVEAIQTAVDPVQNQGEGLGIAPIGHVVTVEGVGEEEVDIATTITYQSGWDWSDIQEAVYAAIDTYFHELSESWAGNDSLIVRISQIETRILSLDGVVDITGTTINGQAQNLTMGENVLPIRGSVSG